jgi:hypothetical protein
MTQSATYYEVKVSAENTRQTHDILTGLLTNKLVTGGQIIEAPAHFLWKGEVRAIRRTSTNKPLSTWSLQSQLRRCP